MKCTAFKSGSWIVSRVRGSVTNNNEFWIVWLYLLTPLQSLLITINYSTIANQPSSQITKLRSILFLLPRCTPLYSFSKFQFSNPPSRAEQSRAAAYCRQPASTFTSGIEPRWDPWPYICWVSRDLFFFFFRCSSFDKREGLGFFIIGVPLLHLIPP
jgi:hypothetical protein